MSHRDDRHEIQRAARGLAEPASAEQVIATRGLADTHLEQKRWRSFDEMEKTIKGMRPPHSRRTYRGLSIFFGLWAAVVGGTDLLMPDESGLIRLLLWFYVALAAATAMVFWSDSRRAKR